MRAAPGRLRPVPSRVGTRQCMHKHLLLLYRDGYRPINFIMAGTVGLQNIKFVVYASDEQVACNDWSML